MKRSAALALFFVANCLYFQPDAIAADCTKTCVEVRREGGELIITARRDPLRVVRPTPVITPAPSPAATQGRTSSARGTGTQPRTQSRTQPRTQPRTQSRTHSPRPSFSDQIREILPEGKFEILPKSGALIHEPLLVRAFGCSEFAKKLPILDTTIELHLMPRMEWNWGDGRREMWGGSATRGAHIYTRPGRYQIQMRCQWSGRYRTPASSWTQIPEGIVSTVINDVELFRAQVFFTQ